MNNTQMKVVATIAMEQKKLTLRSLLLTFHHWTPKLRFLGYLVHNLEGERERKGGEILTGNVFSFRYLVLFD